MTFVLDRSAILNHPRLLFLNDILPIETYLTALEQAINDIFVRRGDRVVQHGRVIVLRATDHDRLVSAFKSAIYLGNYHDLQNRTRFLKRMVKLEHSYEPIRGESLLFLFIGVGKPVYDHLITYSVGRTTRIAAGQRANLPWGYEIPVEARDLSLYREEPLARIRDVVYRVQKLRDAHERDGQEERPEQIQALRSTLPVGYIMPPFLLEFSEEALIKHVFRQRLFEKGAQGATVEVVADMWEATRQIDPEKWETLLDYHGPHLAHWRRAMRTLRDQKITLRTLLQDAGIAFSETSTGELVVKDLLLYDLLMETVGKLPPSMWEKEQEQKGARR